MTRLRSAGRDTVVLVGSLMAALLPMGTVAAGLFQPAYLGGDSYSEDWEQIIYFRDGSLLNAHFMLTNLGPGQHRGFVIATLTTADGRTLLLKNGRSRKKWQPLSNPAQLGIARHRLRATARGYRLDLANSSGEIEVDFQPQRPAWRAKRVYFDTDKTLYQDTAFYAPQLTARGRYRPSPDAPWRPLRGGRGFAEHTLNSTGIHEFATARLRFASIDDGAYRLVGDLLRTRRGKTVLRLALWRGTTLLYRYRQGRFAVQRAGPAQDPTAIVLSADDPRHPLTGNLRLTRRLQRFDVLANMKLIDRLFIGAFSAPVESRYLADYDLEVGGGDESRRLRGRLLVEYIEIHPR